jgi:hypothetical protein
MCVGSKAEQSAAELCCERIDADERRTDTWNAERNAHALNYH